MNPKQAHFIHDHKIYESWTIVQAAKFQMVQDILCILIEYYNRIIEQALGRPVMTAELVYHKEKLLKELVGDMTNKDKEEMNQLLNAADTLMNPT